MILDAIIGLFGSLAAALIAGAAALAIPLFNLIAAGIELLVGLFISGFSLGRIERRKKERRAGSPTKGGIVMLLVIIGLVVGFAVIPKVMNRTVNFTAPDGHSLPFAAVVIHTKNGDRHQRTDNAGNIEIPRFGTHAITIKDPRYVAQTWRKPEIKEELTASRTILGSSLDSFAERLLKPATK